MFMLIIAQWESQIKREGLLTYIDLFILICYNLFMDFYHESNREVERKYYERMLKLMGSLSRLFSDSVSPYLASRVTENLFCRCLNAENLSRSDITADAKKGQIGIGIKTWTGSNLQKIAEFNSDKPSYEHLSDQEMIQRIAELRNERIDFTMRTQNISEMIYHCTIRTPGTISIIECPLENISTGNIHDVKRHGNVITFTDDINRYSFNTSKSTLYKDFAGVEIINSLPVGIIEDPFLLLEEKLLGGSSLEAIVSETSDDSKVYLPLYSKNRSGKFVAEHSGLNARFAGGRARDPYEVYIPVPQEFNNKYRAFFPPSDQPFDLSLPNGSTISAKICQANDKALMSNPNKALGHWLIDDVLKISPDFTITYEMLEKYGIDAVEITKKGENNYAINFAKIDSYEHFMGENTDDDNELDN